MTYSNEELIAPAVEAFCAKASELGTVKMTAAEAKASMGEDWPKIEQAFAAAIEAATKTLVEENKRKDAALDPFASLSFEGTIWDGGIEPDESIVFFCAATGDKITLGDFKRARQALSQGSER